MIDATRRSRQRYGSDLFKSMNGRIRKYGLVPVESRTSLHTRGDAAAYGKGAHLTSAVNSVLILANKNSRTLWKGSAQRSPGTACGMETTDKKLAGDNRLHAGGDQPVSVEKIGGRKWRSRSEKEVPFGTV